VVASKQNYIIGAKDLKKGKVHVFQLPLLLFIFFLVIYFLAPQEETNLLRPSFAALIWVLKVVFSLRAAK
jgi:hypothetical protein